MSGTSAVPWTDLGLQDGVGREPEPPLSVLKEREWSRFHPGLGRVRHLLKKLNHPQRRFPHVLIGGTNGKGTTALNVAAHLPGRVGLFTSPHLWDVRERIKVSDQPVPDCMWKRAYARIARYAEDGELSYFEWLFLLAVEIFAMEAVDWAVFEVGMGGRLDATNALDPCLSCLTSVGLDHTAYLGETMQAIALEKIEIARAQRPFLFPAALLILPEVFTRLQQIQPRLLPVELKGRFEDNFVLAQAILAELGVPRKNWTPRIPEGRREVWSGWGAGLWLDAAHNPQGWLDMVHWLESVIQERLHVVCNLSQGREPHQFLSIIEPIANEITIWNAGFYRQIDATAWPENLLQTQSLNLESLARTPTVVCGSIFLVGAFKTRYAFHGRPA